ncbi:hypothetical protein K6119_09840 [Paracrocinitomix mangrovi]|uniref:hypothetical protein n=1 Tax=Paracrocinitomix mangrovi TaxID=2862509 RepID=UPI001C8DA3A7|nr:hypothetical protein [Paracrocinitomix mangrovi]UKN03791.1 hypothetical protein K6119_09840 [Paracrocinitomix mangrovi]
MSSNLYDISLFNILSLHQKENQSFRKGDFKNSDGTDLSDQKKVIDFLISNDLIEYESDKMLYFLSPETYDLIESSKLEDFLWSKIGEEEQKKHLEALKPREKRELIYQAIEPEVEQEKEPLLGNISKPLMAAIFTTIVALLYFIIPFENKAPEEKGPSPEEIDVLNNVIMINEDGDTLSLDEKQHITQ